MEVLCHIGKEVGFLITAIKFLAKEAIPVNTHPSNTAARVWVVDEVSEQGNEFPAALSPKIDFRVEVWLDGVVETAAGP